MADPKQFDVQGARDAGYSGAEIQLHLIHGLGYAPAEAQRAIQPPRDQQAGFADMLSGVSNFISGLNPFSAAADYYPSILHPDYASFNERFTRTPGIVVPPGNLPVGVDGQYLAGPGLPGSPGNPPGTILIKPDSTSNIISHEAAHALYNQAGLYRWGSKLEDQMNPAVSEGISSSPRYQRAIAQDPSALTDEGLGYAMNSPVPADEAYVNAVASRIEDPVIKKRLLMLFQHAKSMSDPGSNPLKTRKLYKPDK